MDNRIVDLHVHSSESDGTFTPRALAKEAFKQGLSAFALTDHDTVNGIAQARDAASEHGIKLISGIELSTNYQNIEVHILGLFVDETNQEFLNQIHRFRQSRYVRNEKMYSLLREKGFPITEADVRDMFPDSVLTRAHIARYLYEKKYISTISEAFDRYIGEGKSCFVPRDKITPADAIRMIHRVNGIAILAHPIKYHLTKSNLDGLVSYCSLSGLDGIEAIYSTYQTSDEHDIRKLARKYSLAISGGSDFHGFNKPEITMGHGLGHLYIPFSVLDNLCNIAKSRRL
ncbi:MAG: PHP domain-containing protein [Lachnospiraceae bacterium]